MTGSIRMFDRARGFGFISSDDKSSIFFHLQQWKDSGMGQKPIEGERVSFDVEQAKRGPRAINLVRI